MKAGDKVVLIDSMNTLQMFPPKYEDAKQSTFNGGENGVIEEAYESGAGIVNFNGKRVLIWDLNSNLKKEEVECTL